MSRCRTLLVLSTALAGCQEGQWWTRPEPGLERMMDQPKVTALESTRTPPKGTVPVSDVPYDVAIETGRQGKAWLEAIPIPVDRPLVEEGRTRFEIVCATCHGILGDGDSPAAKNMVLRKPPSLHEREIREMPPGRLFAIASEGFGLMPGYAAYLTARERWGIVAYVRALQLSRHAKVAELPPRVVKRLEEATR